MGNRYDRQLDIIKYSELTIPIHILGAGGIGSWVALLAAKMGCSNIIVYDEDKVENHNVASQFYKEDQLDVTKLEALKENILEQTGIEIQCASIMEEEFIQNGLVVIAIDSMEGRIKLGNLYKGKDIFIIDGRMGGLTYEVYAVHSSRYLSTTVEPDEVSHDVCTAKSICYNCAGVASVMVDLIKKYIKGEIEEMEFFFDYVSLSMVKKKYSTVISATEPLIAAYSNSVSALGAVTLTGSLSTVEVAQERPTTMRNDERELSELLEDF